MNALDQYDFCAYHLRELTQKVRHVMACGGKKKPKGGKSGKGGGK